MDKVGKQIPWGEAIDLVEQLQLDMGSHLFMSMAGWSYPMSQHELTGALLMARVVNATQEPGAKPFVWEWPWHESSADEAVSKEERDSSRSTLSANSAFAQVRT